MFQTFLWVIPEKDAQRVSEKIAAPGSGEFDAAGKPQDEVPRKLLLATTPTALLTQLRCSASSVPSPRFDFAKKKRKRDRTPLLVEQTPHIQIHIYIYI